MSGEKTLSLMVELETEGGPAVVVVVLHVAQNSDHFVVQPAEAQVYNWTICTVCINGAFRLFSRLNDGCNDYNIAAL